MALNTSKCNHLTPLLSKGLSLSCDLFVVFEPVRWCSPSSSGSLLRRATALSRDNKTQVGEAVQEEGAVRWTLVYWTLGTSTLKYHPHSDHGTIIYVCRYSRFSCADYSSIT